MISYRHSIIMVTAVGAALVLAATAYAGTSAGESEYAGCVDASTGALRMVSPGPGGQCQTTETPILWRGIEGSRTPSAPSGAPGHGESGTPTSGNDSPRSGSAGNSDHSVVVNTRTASAPIDGQTVVEARCEQGEVPVNGYFEVDGEDPIGNPKIFYSLGDTRETRDGFKASVGPNPFFVGEPASDVTAFARCLVTG